MSKRHLISAGARASARFNVSQSTTFCLELANEPQKRRERRAPLGASEVIAISAATRICAATSAARFTSWPARLSFSRFVHHASFANMESL
jgi:hypothetical protein